jgi:hypothetical protein
MTATLTLRTKERSGPHNHCQQRRRVVKVPLK